MKSSILLSSILLFSVSAHADEAQFRSLFNGKDLTGWKGEYAVEDGALVCKKGNLVSEATFSHYILEFEFRLPPGGNNGLGVHYPGHGDGAYTGMELQILDDTAEKYKDLKDYQFHGSLYTLAPAKRTKLKPTGEWNKQRVSVLGPAMSVETNGEMILRADLDTLNKTHPKHEGAKRRAGHIAFLGHGDPVAFRNIRVLEFPPTANEEGVKTAGFTQIFDGNSLTGWKHTPDTTNWTAHNGILKHTGRPGTIKDLWTEKEYGDMILVFDWRWSERGPMKQQPIVMPDGTHKETTEVEEVDSGIYLRGSPKCQVNLWNWTVGSGEVYGYRTDKNQTPEVRAAVTPKVKADRPLGEWNRMMITIKGNTLSVMLNNKAVITDAVLPGVPERGPIGLQHHGAAIDFANIWIKEL